MATRRICLTRGYFAIVDEGDYERVNKYLWQVHIKGLRGQHKYATTQINDKTVWMHRLIIGAPKGMFVDHIDGDGLNNCRSNLRLCTMAQNQWHMVSPTRNATGFRAVKFDKRMKCRKNPYTVECRGLDGKKVHLGSFPTAEDASRRYLDWCKQNRGSFLPIEAGRI